MLKRKMIKNFTWPLKTASREMSSDSVEFIISTSAAAASGGARPPRSTTSDDQVLAILKSVVEPGAKGKTSNTCSHIGC